MTEQTISQAISAYLASVAEARKEHTARTYANALNVFSAVLKERWLDLVKGFTVVVKPPPLIECHFEEWGFVPRRNNH